MAFDGVSHVVTNHPDVSRSDTEAGEAILPSDNGDNTTAAAAALQAALRGRIDGEVRFSRGDRAIYSTDASSYRQLPIGVVIPHSVEDVVATVELCHEFGIPVLSRGGGTSLAGQCCNAAVVMDFSKHLHRILELDRDKLLARVQPGLVLDVLRDLGESAQPPVTFGPTPSTHDHCTLGGMIGNNVCGNYSIMSEFYGAGPRMAHNVAEMEVLTYDGARMRVGPTSDAALERIIAEGGRRGQIYGDLRALRDRYADLIRARLPEFPRRVSGYNLDGLLPERGFNLAYALVGTESTCVTVLEATVHLVPSFPARSLVVVGFDDLYAAAEQIMAAREHRPVALEGFDATLIEDNRKLGIHRQELDMLPAGKGWLLAEFGGETKTEADDKARAFMAHMRKGAGYAGEKLYDNPDSEKRIWEVRESGLGATAYVPGSVDTYEGWEDSAVPPENLAGYLRDLRALFNTYNYGCALYGHFGQGCVHTRIDWDPHTVDGVRKWRRFIDDASDLVLSYGGSLSGEHGDGQSRGELLEKMYGPEVVQAFREFKAVWDPQGKMNPGKVVDPYPITSNLRLGPHYSPIPVRTHFSYPKDHGNFAHAATRCVGVGKCRRLEGGTMCPSFMVTREEKHSTRGRARLLHEMMRKGSEIELWNSDEVRDGLELCLSCKGCKSDCPVNVDMATYKAEFLSHHYRSRLRPRAAYAMGLIYWWARAGVVCAEAGQCHGACPARVHGGQMGGRDRAATPGAPLRHSDVPGMVRGQTASDPVGASRARVGGHVQQLSRSGRGHRHRRSARSGGVRRSRAPGPAVLRAAALRLRHARHRERLLRRIVDQLQPMIQAGIPLVGVEPSCLAVFRDELPELLPEDLDAGRLSAQSYTLSEFLRDHAGEWQMPTLHRKAIVHGHCHHKAVMGFDAEESVFERLGLDVEVLDAGCCGLAGSFGFEKGEKYDVSIAAGERVLLPAVRRVADTTLVITDGFSCRTQIEHNTDRRPLHLAEVIRMALEQGPAGPGWGRPEERKTGSTGGDNAARGTRPRTGAALAVAGSAAAGTALYVSRRARARRVG